MYIAVVVYNVYIYHFTKYTSCLTIIGMILQNIVSQILLGKASLMLRYPSLLKCHQSTIKFIGNCESEMSGYFQLSHCV